MGDIFETAYIELIDARSSMSSPITTARTKSALSGLSAARTQKMAKSNVFKVQFNPSSLKFSEGSGGSSEGKKGLASDAQGNTQDCEVPNGPARLKLSVSLIFDRSTYADSSVQPEVEGFLAIIKNPFTRKVSFNWGKLYFLGQVNNLSASYTMFNRLGIPVRASVELSMELFDTSV